MFKITSSAKKLLHIKKEKQQQQKKKNEKKKTKSYQNINISKHSSNSNLKKTTQDTIAMLLF